MWLFTWLFVWGSGQIQPHHWWTFTACVTDWMTWRTYQATQRILWRDGIVQCDGLLKFIAWWNFRGYEFYSVMNFWTLRCYRSYSVTEITSCLCSAMDSKARWTLQWKKCDCKLHSLTNLVAWWSLKCNRFDGPADFLAAWIVQYNGIYSVIGFL